MTGDTPSRAGVTPPGSGPQPEERHRKKAHELVMLMIEKAAGNSGIERVRRRDEAVAAWLARFEAEVRGDEAERCKSRIEAAIEGYGHGCACGLRVADALSLRGGGSRSEEGGER